MKILNFLYVVDIHFNDRLGKLKISDDILRDEMENFFLKRIPFCGVLGGGYKKILINC